jgi:hypothetical protein
MKNRLAFLTMAVALAAALTFLTVPETSAKDASSLTDSSKFQRSLASAAAPNYLSALHNIGNMAFGVTNFGRIGIGNQIPVYDCFTRVSLPSCQFPKGYSQVYLYKGGIWLGGIVGTDTLVSCGADINNWYRELNPDPRPAGQIIKRSILDPQSNEYIGALSEQDFIASYSDTVTTSSFPSFDQVSNRSHKPLGLQIQQSSYEWSYGYAADFTLFNLRIRNSGKNLIKQAYVGVYMDMDVGRYAPNAAANLNGNTSKPVGVGIDDYTGFLESEPAIYEDYPCLYNDTVQIAWTADNDGDPNNANATFVVPNILGVRFLEPVKEDQRLSYNWWVTNYNSNYDYGPQLRKNFRNMGNGTGTPMGDRNKYAMMSNGEIDLDQVTLGLRSDLDPDLIPPNWDAVRNLIKGADNSFLLSIGPYELSPGDEVSVPFALVGGERFHRNVDNWYLNIQWRYDPSTYYGDLNFADFAKNGAWAEKVYDNPGVDTDSDGYAGKFHICPVDSQKVNGHWVTTATDTIYYTGDGVPDWRAASPPPAPTVWVIPKMDGLTVRWNGYRSETTRDFLTNEYDFEGYRVYLGRDEREGSLALQASYDREDYDIYFWNPNHKPKAAWELQGSPVTREQLRCRFSKQDDPCNDSTFNPLLFPSGQPWRSGVYLDSIFYFAPHEANAYQFGGSTPIRRRFPDAVRPADPGNPTPEDLTDDGYLKYWEYTCDIDRLLPTVSYYVNVTSFDYGSPKQGLLPLETSRSLHPKASFPFADKDQTVGGALPPVYIYPNPYRINENYRSRAFEGYGQLDKSDDRVRAIHFVNLPPKCTIRILTLDGDLVRQIDHDVDPSNPLSNHDKWDMISRNTQAIVSGIYYWTVEGSDGKVQIGKLVVIM